MSDTKFIVKLVVGMLVVLLVIMAFPLGMNITYNYYYCDSRAKLMPEYDFQWELWGGCLMQVNGIYINAGQYLDMHQGRLELDTPYVP